MWSKLSAGLQIVQEKIDHVLEDVSITDKVRGLSLVDVHLHVHCIYLIHNFGSSCVQV